MREIKFRVFSKSEGMRYSFDDWSNDVDVLKDVWKYIDDYGYFIIQYTGLKDKNGKEIYEGDIVRGKFYSDIGVVKWMNERCGFFVISNGVGTDIVNRKPFQSAYKMNSCKLEVIGNIYENPELLK